MANWTEVFQGLQIPTEIDPKEYGVDLVRDKPIDVAEASIYAGTGKVVKVYDGFRSYLIDWFVLCRYTQLTKTVGRLVTNNPQIEEIFGCPVRVVLIERVGVVTRRSYLCAVSEFIGGKNVNQLGLQGEERTVMIARFARLNDFLQNATEEPAVRVDFNNAKFEADGRTLVVTDVSGVIAMLNPAYYDQPAMLL